MELELRDDQDFRFGTSVSDDEASEIAELTGYKQLPRLTRPLLRQLIDAGITPFDPKNVHVYKLRAVREAREKDVFSLNFFWQRTPLCECTQEVPVFALRLAADIKRQIPNAALYVETLTYDPDPFLVVKRGAEEYHVAVWDEPGFHDIALD